MWLKKIVHLFWGLLNSRVQKIILRNIEIYKYDYFEVKNIPQNIIMLFF